MPQSAAAPAKLTYTPAQVISLKEHPHYNEAWLEKQITVDSTALGLEQLKIVKVQRNQKKAGRLDILAEDETNQYVYTIELMLGQLDSSHIVRAIDYWLREKARKQKEDWQVISVIAAEDVRGSRYSTVTRFLSEKMPLVVIEMRALQVGDRLTLSPTILFDGRDQIDAELPDEPAIEVDEKYWIDKASPESIDVMKQLDSIVKKVGPDMRVKWNQGFVGILVGHKAINFVTFVPKKQWVRVHAKWLTDTDSWSKKLTKAGFDVVGGTPGHSIRFRATTHTVQSATPLLVKLFAECYAGRIGTEDGE